MWKYELRLVNTLILKEIVDEVFQDYKKPAMFICSPSCDWKCCKELDLPISVCQNSQVAQKKSIRVENGRIINRYLTNPITSAIIIGGLEPFQLFDDVLAFIQELRKVTDDDVVIYTGYLKSELTTEITRLSEFKNIIIKFGRYKPTKETRWDEILGVELVSDNQWAEKIS